MLLGQISDVEQKIKAIEKSGHTDILTSYQTYSEKRKLVSQYEAGIENLKNQIKSTSSATVVPSIDESAFDVQDSREAELLSKLHSLNNSALSFKEVIEKAAASLEHELNQFKGWYSESGFNKRHIEANNKYNELIDALRSEGVESPSDYAKLIDERDTIKNSLKNIELVSSQLTQLDSLINSSYQEIVECRKKLTQSRLEFLRKKHCRKLVY